MPSLFRMWLWIQRTRLLPTIQPANNTWLCGITTDRVTMIFKPSGWIKTANPSGVNSLSLLVLIMSEDTLLLRIIKKVTNTWWYGKIIMREVWFPVMVFMADGYQELD